MFLVGMMGAGKSTVGPPLAERLGRPFVDTDHAIEALAGAPVATIFAERGEAPLAERQHVMVFDRDGASADLGLGSIAAGWRPGESR